MMQAMDQRAIGEAVDQLEGAMDGATDG